MERGGEGGTRTAKLNLLANLPPFPSSQEGLRPPTSDSSGRGSVGLFPAGASPDDNRPATGCCCTPPAFIRRRGGGSSGSSGFGGGPGFQGFGPSAPRTLLRSDVDGGPAPELPHVLTANIWTSCYVTRDPAPPQTASTPRAPARVDVRTATCRFFYIRDVSVCGDRSRYRLP